jgi:hypothetical protein
VRGNTASTGSQGYGGGVALGEGQFTLSGNTVGGNTASAAGEGFGGGIMVEDGDVTLEGNDVQLNTASAITMGLGGGVVLWGGNATLSANAILGNTATFSLVATGRGGGLAVADGIYFTLTNNLVANNLAYTEGSGLWIDNYSGSPSGGRLLHTTIAHNLGSGQGVFVGDHTIVAFTNTIIAGHHSVGITVTTGSTATLEATLWYNSGPDTGGGGTVISSTNVTGDPAFASPLAWDYHLTSTSAAIDRGVDAGVTTDIDSNSRPQGAGYDIGAYEYVLRVYLPLVLRQ